MAGFPKKFGPQHICKGQMWDKHGRRCVVGWIGGLIIDDPEKYIKAISYAIKVTGHHGLTIWNDSEKTTKKEIADLLNKVFDFVGVER